MQPGGIVATLQECLVGKLAQAFLVMRERVAPAMFDLQLLAVVQQIVQLPGVGGDDDRGGRGRRGERRLRKSRQRQQDSPSC